MKNLSSMICSHADKNDIESSKDKNDGPGFRFIPPIKTSDSSISSSNKNKMSYAFEFSMSTIMQTDPHPVSFYRNHDILSIKEWRWNCTEAVDQNDDMFPRGWTKTNRNN